MKLFAAVKFVLLAGALATLGCGATDKELALRLIQDVGGSVNYDSQGQVVSVDLSDTDSTDEQLAAISVLPHVRTINCTNASKITGSDLDLLVKLPNLETLYLVGTDLDDTGLSRLKGLTTLKTLHLGRTRITDAGMPALDNLSNLQTLSLGNTAITDAGLVQLRDLRKLSTLILRKTKTTPRGVQDLQRMLPDVRIEN